MLFGNIEKEVFLEVQTNRLNVFFTELRLHDWLRDNHEDIFWDIELHEKGLDGVHFSGDEILFSGDNGRFTLNRISPEVL
jgi:hypothetical protein